MRHLSQRTNILSFPAHQYFGLKTCLEAVLK